jgi:thiol-disulfide isomerase/thioredoxin|uniref:Thioredoxin domain-containing protein n=1 Tax=viral metagenome TaxID=1070528 RepID=A0A6C0BGP7_9ZZZZ
MEIIKCVFIGLVIFVIAIALTLVVKKYAKKENFTNDGSVKVCLFYATWCGHCERYLASKVFDKTYTSVKGHTNNIVFEKIDYDQNQNLAEKYDINSFPTIIAIDGSGKKIDKFNGDRYDINALEQFAIKAAATH